MGLKALNGGATENSEEPATEGLAGREVLEGSCLACPLLLFSTDPYLNRHPATLSPGTLVVREKDQLCSSKVSMARWLQSHPNKPGGILHFKCKSRKTINRHFSCERP